VADGSLSLNQGDDFTIAPGLEQKGWITSTWGTSENNRRARFYSITAKAGGNWPRRPKAGPAGRRRRTNCW
jgi:hypothetical protein